MAALFAVHPLRVESVAWVAERKDVLSGCLGLLALMAYARYVEGRRQKAEGRRQKPEGRGPWSLSHPRSSFFYVLSLLLFALGLMSKPMLVTLPFVMLLLDYWPLGRKAECRMQNAEVGSRKAGAGAAGIVQGRSWPWMKLVWEKVPFFALAAAVSVATFVVQKHGGSVKAAGDLPPGARSGNALIWYWRHLGKLFWPTDLAVFYPHPGHWPLAKVLLAGGLMLGLSVLLFVRRRRCPYLLMGWLWFVGMLVPMIGLVQTGGQAMADRHSYLPSLGVLVLTIWGAYELTRRWRYGVIGLSVAGAAAIVLCMVLTREQLGHWKDSEALFRHALEVTENNYLAHMNLGVALDQKGQVDEAIRHYQEAIRLKPNYADAHYNLGNALGRKGQIDEAIRQYGEVIRLQPNDADAHNTLGTALNRQGRNDEAIRQFQEAIRLKPDYADAHNSLGIALGRKGQMDEAIRQFQQAIRVKPHFAQAHYNLGIACGKKGQIDEAIRQYQQAIRLQPDYADAHNNLGAALCRQGRNDEAIHQFQEALRLKPDDADARKNLDAVLATETAAPPQPGAAPKP